MRCLLAPLAMCALRNAFAARTTKRYRPAAIVDNDGDGLDDNFEMQCAEKFKPVTYLHTDEKYGPSTVESYLQSCYLRKMDSCSSWSSLLEVDGSAKQDSNASRANCPYAIAIATRLAGCWWRDEDETVGQATTELLGRYQNRDGMYLRCLGCHGNKCNNMGAGNSGTRGALTAEELRSVPYYVHVSPESGAINIQYWLFYPFNGPTIGFGVHQGDWEHLAMRVDANCTRRLQYRSSAHGGGDGWKDEGSGGVEYENGALVSYQAVNSHAGFMTEGTHEGGTIITKDETNKGPRWFPDGLVNVGETTCSGGGRRPMSPATAFVDFGGQWGTASAFDGVLSGIPTVGEICPSGPGWSFNKHTAFSCRGR